MNDVEKDVKDLVSQHAPIEPFITPGLKTIHAGTLGIFKGGIIGLPQYFEFNDVREVDNKVVVYFIVSNIYLYIGLIIFNNCSLLSELYTHITQV